MTMITQQYAIEIAKEYVLSKTGRELRFMSISFKESKSVSYIVEPTWIVWFWPALEGVAGEVEIYVDAMTGEPWELNYGSPDDASNKVSE